jgi:hypothetical protein
VTCHESYRTCDALKVGGGKQRRSRRWHGKEMFAYLVVCLFGTSRRKNKNGPLGLEGVTEKDRIENKVSKQRASK